MNYDYNYKNINFAFQNQKCVGVEVGFVKINFVYITHTTDIIYLFCLI